MSTGTRALPIAVTPITLRKRVNPYATGPTVPVGRDELPNTVDSRTLSLFGAGWTLAALKYLAETEKRKSNFVVYIDIEQDLGSAEGLYSDPSLRRIGRAFQAGARTCSRSKIMLPELRHVFGTATRRRPDRAGRSRTGRRSSPDHVGAGQGPFPLVWRVKDSNLGRHQPTDLQPAAVRSGCARLLTGSHQPCPPRALHGERQWSFTTNHGQLKPLLSGSIMFNPGR